MSVAIIKTHIRREFWEHKTGFIYAPVVATGLFLCLLAYVAFSFVHGISEGRFPFTGDIDFHMGATATYHIDGKDEEATQKFSTMMNDFSSGNKDALNILFGTILGINFGLIMIVGSVVLAVYNHGCLFDDRKNRDILFWRSMPVSETTNVLVKLGMLLFAFPLVALALNLAVTLITIAGASIFLLSQGANIAGWSLALFKSGVLLLGIELSSVAVIFMLALMPLIGFVLWVSAFAKKSPFLIAALVPVGVLMLDKLLQTYLGINIQVIDALSAYTAFLAKMASFFDVGKSLYEYGALAGQTLLAVAVGGLFVVAAIWFRNNRYEI